MAKTFGTPPSYWFPECDPTEKAAFDAEVLRVGAEEEVARQKRAERLAKVRQRLPGGR